MSHFSRGARVASRSTRRVRSTQPRRFDSHHTPKGDSALHVAGGTGSESFGKGLYIGIALVPLSIIAYSVASSSPDPLLTRFINAYRYREETWDRRNTLHEAALQQAAHDRNLLMSQPMDRSGPELMFPEQFNAGSPWNVAAGEQGANLTNLVSHYEEKNAKIEEARVARMKEGKVTTVYDDTTGGRLSGFPWSSKKKESMSESDG